MAALNTYKSKADDGLQSTLGKKCDHATPKAMEQCAHPWVMRYEGTTRTGRQGTVEKTFTDSTNGNGRTVAGSGRTLPVISAS